MAGYFYIYKITYPNGKIYVGSDVSAKAEMNLWTYFGSLSLPAIGYNLKDW